MESKSNKDPRDFLKPYNVKSHGDLSLPNELQKLVKDYDPAYEWYLNLKSDDDIMKLSPDTLGKYLDTFSVDKQKDAFNTVFKRLLLIVQNAAQSGDIDTIKLLAPKTKCYHFGKIYDYILKGTILGNNKDAIMYIVDNAPIYWSPKRIALVSSSQRGEKKILFELILLREYDLQTYQDALFVHNEQTWDNNERLLNEKIKELGGPTSPSEEIIVY